MSLEGVDDIERGDCFPLSVFGVGDRVSDDVLEEDFEYSSGLFIDQAGDTLDSPSTSKSSDGRLSDTLDVITQDLAVTLGTALAETLSAALSASRHVEIV